MSASLVTVSGEDRLPIALICQKNNQPFQGQTDSVIYIKEGKTTAIPAQLKQNIDTFCTNEGIFLNDEKSTELINALTTGVPPASGATKLVFERFYDPSISRSIRPPVMFMRSPPNSTLNYHPLKTTTPTVQQLSENEDYPWIGIVDRIYLSGCPGAGKSHWIGVYINNYKKIHPNNKVYMVSMKPQGRDSTLKKLGADKLIDKYLNIKDMIIEEKTEVDEEGEEVVVETEEQLYEIHDNDSLLQRYENSLVVFDDIEDTSDVQGRRTQRSKFQIVQKFKAMLIRISREYNTSVISTVHKLLSGKQSEVELSSCTAVVIFTKGTQSQSYSWLEHHVRASRDKIEAILALESRWIMLGFNPYRYILTEKTMEILR